MSHPERNLSGRLVKTPLLVSIIFLGFICAGMITPGLSFWQEPALTETTWRLMAFGADRDQDPELEKIEITIVFSQAGRLTGSAGCNRYFGSYQVRGDQLFFPRIGVTQMACPPPVMELEKQFLSALESVAGWERKGKELQLQDAEGDTLLRLTPPRDGPPSRLTG